MASDDFHLSIVVLFRSIIIMGSTMSFVLLSLLVLGRLKICGKIIYRTPKSWYLTQLGMVLCHFLCSNIAMIAEFSQTTWLCRWGMRIATISFGSVHVFVYLFLYLRSKVVPVAFAQSYTILRVVLVVITLVQVIYILPSALTQSDGTLIQLTDHSSTSCAFWVPQSLCIVALIMDLIICSGLIFIFLYPAFQHLAGAEETRTGGKIVENAIVSMIMTASTTVSLAFASWKRGSPNDLIVACCLAQLDAAICVTCALLLTRNAWKPKKAVQRTIRKKNMETEAT